jgi:hypothetical protein
MLLMLSSRARAAEREGFTDYRSLLVQYFGGTIVDEEIGPKKVAFLKATNWADAYYVANKADGVCLQVSCEMKDNRELTELEKQLFGDADKFAHIFSSSGGANMMIMILSGRPDEMRILH